MDREPTPLKQIRTFQGDVAEALQKEHGSLVSIQQAEHSKRSAAQSATTVPSEDAKRRAEFLHLFLGSLILLALGAIGTWYAYHKFIQSTTTPIMATPANRFIAADTETDLKLGTASREMLIKTLTDMTRDSEAGKIKQIVLTKESAGGASGLLSTSEFLAALETRAPGSLVRAFDPLFMFGTFGQSAFLIIKLTSFGNAFAGMLAWEKNLNQDIGPLFATAELSKNVPPGSAFTDITDQNKDVRALVLGDQNILLYSFFDNNMLLITDHIETLRMLVERLTREKLSR